MLAQIIHTIETCYSEDAKGQFFYDNGKYLERALLHYGNDLVPDNLRCEIDKDEQIAQQSPFGASLKNNDGKMDFDKHLTNLLTYHKNEQPLTSLLGFFQQLTWSDHGRCQHSDQSGSCTSRRQLEH